MNKLTLATKYGKWYYIFPQSWSQTPQTGKSGKSNKISWLGSLTLESRIIGGVVIIGGLDIVIIINNRGLLEW